MVAGERTPGAGGPVLSRRQADDQQARIFIAEGRDWRGMVTRMLRADVFQESSQARAIAAVRIEPAVAGCGARHL
jgi:hypothetical protein